MPTYLLLHTRSFRLSELALKKQNSFKVIQLETTQETAGVRTGGEKLQEGTARSCAKGVEISYRRANTESKEVLEDFQILSDNYEQR